MSIFTQTLVDKLSESFITSAGATLGVFSTLVFVILPFTKRFSPNAYSDITGKKLE